MNAASQAVVWSRAASMTGIPSASFAHDGSLTRRLRPQTRVTTRTDHPLPHYRIAPLLLRKLFTRLATGQLSHLLNEGNLAFASDPRRFSFSDEVRTNMFDGQKIGVVFHGTDARDPTLAMELDQSSFFFDADADWVDSVGRRAARNRAQVAALGVPTFVTTPDMLAHVPGSTLLPISVDAREWQASAPAFEREIPRVLHRSSGGAFTKGSKYIRPVLKALAHSGLIELIDPPVLPRAEMADLIKNADIVVDQIQAGTYGVTGIEAMAAGRLVIANINAHIGGSEEASPPVLHATPISFEEVMRQAVSGDVDVRSLAARGPRYVERLHDGRAAALVLREFVRGAGSNTWI